MSKCHATSFDAMIGEEDERMRCRKVIRLFYIDKSQADTFLSFLGVVCIEQMFSKDDLV